MSWKCPLSVKKIGERLCRLNSGNVRDLIRYGYGTTKKIFDLKPEPLQFGKSKKENMTPEQFEQAAPIAVRITELSQQKEKWEKADRFAYEAFHGYPGNSVVGRGNNGPDRELLIIPDDLFLVVRKEVVKSLQLQIESCLIEMSKI